MSDDCRSCISGGHRHQGGRGGRLANFVRKVAEFRVLAHEIKFAAPNVFAWALDNSLDHV